MKSLEIPHPEDRNWKYRFFEILPGAISYTVLLLPAILGFLSPKLAAYFIIAYLMLWFVRAVGLDYRSLQGWILLGQHRKLPWRKLNEDLEALEPRVVGAPKWHTRNIERVATYLGDKRLKPSQALHAIIVASYKESFDTLAPTIQSVLDSDFDPKQIILFFTYEERGGPGEKAVAEQLRQRFQNKFFHFQVTCHPDGIPGEVQGKGSNLTYAGRELQKYLEKEKIDLERVIVTTLDGDNRPDKQYLSALTYTFCSTEEPRYVSYQPIPMFLNNIWDAPAPMRVIATGNSFWNIVLSLRPHMLRNFSSHAQPMVSLIDTDFWSVRSIVEDGHQYWRTYFRYDGRHEVYPIYVPIYQDAVLTHSYRNTLKAQFYQLRRWAYGASDVSYVAYMGFMRKNKIRKISVFMKFFRLLEGHVSWATAPLVLLFAALVPFFLHPQSYLANQLPQVASKLQTIAMFGILISLFLSFRSLPPKPARYKKKRNLWMLLQWVYLPITGIIYNASAALNSQTHLMFGKYIGKFDVTEKAQKEKAKG